jgi:membrane protein EpsK
MIINILIGLFFTPYLIEKLGIAVYGLIPLANSVIQNFSLINYSLNSSAGRYLSIDITNGSKRSANQTFNTAFWGNIGLLFITVLILIALINFIPNFFNIPKGYEHSAQILFLAIIISYFLTIIRTNFSISSWVKNRFDLSNLVLAISYALRVGLVVLFFQFIKPQIIIVGVGLLIAELVCLIGNIAIWKKLTPELTINIRYFDKSRVKRIFGTGGWLLINQVAAHIFNSSDLIIINLFIGAEEAGIYGALLTFPTLIQRLTTSISHVLSPIIVKKFAINEQESIFDISYKSLKYLGFFIALPIGLICGTSESIMKIWLGAEFADYNLLIVLLVGYFLITSSIAPLFSITLAMNKVTIPAIKSTIFSLIKVGLAIYLINIGWGVMGVALANFISISLNGLLTPIYVAFVLKRSWWTYLKLITMVIISGSSIGLSAYLLRLIIDFDSLLKLIATYSAVGTIYLSILYFVILNAEDRKFIMKLFSTFFQPN